MSTFYALCRWGILISLTVYAAMYVDSIKSPTQQAVNPLTNAVKTMSDTVSDVLNEDVQRMREKIEHGGQKEDSKGITFVPVK